VREITGSTSDSKMEESSHAGLSSSSTRLSTMNHPEGSGGGRNSEGPLPWREDKGMGEANVLDRLGKAVRRRQMIFFIALAWGLTATASLGRSPFD